MNVSAGSRAFVFRPRRSYHLYWIAALWLAEVRSRRYNRSASFALRLQDIAFVYSKKSWDVSYPRHLVLVTSLWRWFLRKCSYEKWESLREHIPDSLSEELWTNTRARRHLIFNRYKSSVPQDFAVILKPFSWEHKCFLNAQALCIDCLTTTQNHMWSDEARGLQYFSRVLRVYFSILYVELENWSRICSNGLLCFEEGICQSEYSSLVKHHLSWPELVTLSITADERMLAGVLHIHLSAFSPTFRCLLLLQGLRWNAFWGFTLVRGSLANFLWKFGMVRCIEFWCFCRIP